MSQPIIPPRQILFSRRSAAELLNTSIDTIKRLEKLGRLTPVRLTGAKSSVFLRADELFALAQGEADA